MVQKATSYSRSLPRRTVVRRPWPSCDQQHRQFSDHCIQSGSQPGRQAADSSDVIYKLVLDRVSDEYLRISTWDEAHKEFTPGRGSASGSSRVQAASRRNSG